MRIGIVPALTASGGGVYQYSITMLGALGEWKEQACEDEFILFARQAPDPMLLNGRDWTFKPLLPVQPRSQREKILEASRRIVGEGPHREAWRWLRRQLEKLQYNPDLVRSRPDITRWFQCFGVDLMFYSEPDPLSFETGMPYVMAIHDLQHRLQPEFPEVSADGEWELREYIFRNGARYATLLLADSEVGKEDILNFYGPCGVTPDQVKVLPYLPASYLAVDIAERERQRVRATYRLPERYLFYPAQFWPHKNHARIVQALAALKKQHGLKIPIVFCGSHTGKIREHTFNEVMSLSSRLGLEREIHYLGYVPNEDISGIYAEATALVMPTFFGPTNIPVLEAWAFGCPVLTSDIRGIREQTGNAALLVNPCSEESIADGIYQLCMDEDLRCLLADRGRQRLASYTASDYRQRLIEIVEDAKARVPLRKQKSVQQQDPT
jgi:glycosyltransferase involved in cell wall biosynthesis